MADKVATALNAAATRADNMAQEILCCYTSSVSSESPPSLLMVAKAVLPHSDV